jgi:hypothetical protein
MSCLASLSSACSASCEALVYVVTHTPNGARSAHGRGTLALQGVNQFTVVAFLSAVSGLTLVLMWMSLGCASCLTVFPVSRGACCMGQIWGLRLEMCDTEFCGV